MSSTGKLDGRVVLITGAARMAVIPIGDDSSYCTGAEFVADGGMLA
jgi:NAD(P)-dependent dehydrogenase (short-subunit alcohol dehydrogenase family)